MNMPKNCVAASIFVSVLAICTQANAEDVFKSSEFLKWSEAQRSFYIRTSVGMASLISRYNDEPHAKCLEEWYYSDEGKSNNVIYDVMHKYPNDHPRGLIFAVMKKQCGSFNYSE